MIEEKMMLEKDIEDLKVQKRKLHSDISKRGKIIKEQENKLNAIKDKIARYADMNDDLNRRFALVDERQKMINRIESGELTRYEIAQWLPCENDTEELKRAFYYLFNALSANGGAMKPFNPKPNMRCNKANNPFFE